MSGKVITKGRRRAIFIFESLAIVGSLICQFLTVPTLCVGRFALGLASGVLTVCFSKSIYETVPENVSGLFVGMTNFYITLGVMLATLAGVALPTNKDDFKDDEMWRLVYACPIIIALLQISLFIFVYKTEPILFCIRNNDDKSAQQIMRLVFKPSPNHKTEEEIQIALDRLTNKMRLQSNKETSNVTFRDAVCGPLYARATWICFIFSVLE